MDILFLLVPLSVVLVLCILGLFAWALKSGQFDNVEREGERILWDDAPPVRATVDGDQGAPETARQQ
ncbi:cbb3-type cytochrome oxidase assembly protein CcoS [Caldimonas thermodepolymerans]|jgi:cbb3-type cytochrome oxidase maturation protein|uniref:Cbb3-type cytochrome oxidase assembly protein CcoS n=1 Tax=Caldimonas thermodepolymerans TaxID=215580 RepID=A0A2S5T5R6_9BURK|nr:cbb3-type cytochrome oxidase assembly protein CcoS [Caldimonas thermodepolymerans]QPC30255.1 cbb3-type cytochrome oxidase assembly protein CcoS [Caldimonas thermodepolymerans]RDI00644.1 cbb3-type cytochrome oxidase maturation protein [Caldimonas thermodepolymerans]TCP07077.1 cbb3-type cytochrome oxidase maturation protein [Caldimonas thermodepolymerans]